MKGANSNSLLAKDEDDDPMIGGKSLGQLKKKQETA